MREFELLKRSIARKSGLYSGKSSWPLISGDTYRALCDFQIDNFQDIPKLELASSLSGNIFLRAEVSTLAIDFILSRSQIDLSNARIIIHNGDFVPDRSALIRLSDRVKFVYSVNLLFEHPKISPLPIGLENWSYLRNGVPSDFRHAPSKNRDITLLVSFNDKTNPAERSLARDYAKSINGVVFLSPETTPREYRNSVMRSEFVLSPPGNGPDCHRSWESFYLGATPIVKAEFWPFKNSSLPALVVTDWAEVSNELLLTTKRGTVSQTELFDKYVKPFEHD